MTKYTQLQSTPSEKFASRANEVNRSAGWFYGLCWVTTIAFFTPFTPSVSRASFSTSLRRACSSSCPASVTTPLKTATFTFFSSQDRIPTGSKTRATLIVNGDHEGGQDQRAPEGFRVVNAPRNVQKHACHGRLRGEPRPRFSAPHFS